MKKYCYGVSVIVDLFFCLCVCMCVNMCVHAYSYECGVQVYVCTQCMRVSSARK